MFTSRRIDRDHRSGRSIGPRDDVRDRSAVVKERLPCRRRRRASVVRRNGIDRCGKTDGRQPRRHWPAILTDMPVSRSARSRLAFDTSSPASGRWLR